MFTVALRNSRKNLLKWFYNMAHQGCFGVKVSRVCVDVDMNNNKSSSGRND